jgi:hypothetical protein
MEPTLHIFYRHVHSRADAISRDPNKRRPSWFSYERCFRNLMYTIREDPLGHRVRVTIMFDGALEEYADDFSSKYQANENLNIDFRLLSGGSDKNSSLITLHHARNSACPDQDLFYMLENDYMHAPGWVTKVFDLLESRIPFHFASLYDHADKYFLEMYENLSSRIYHSRSHHWRSAPSTCSSCVMTFGQLRADFDVFGQVLPDYYLFTELVGKRDRLLLTPLPGLATHCMEGYMSPTVDWSQFVV